MPEIILTEEQARTYSQARQPIELRDPEGNLLTLIEPPVTPEFIAECKRRAASPGPRYSGKEIQARLQALQEAWDREGGFGRERMLEILEALRQRGQS